MSMKFGANILSLIHSYFVAQQLLDAFSPGSSYPSTCPQCQNRSFSMGTIKLVSGLREGYAPLLDQEGEPRTSVKGPREGGSESMA